MATFSLLSPSLSLFLEEGSEEEEESEEESEELSEEEEEETSSDEDALENLRKRYLKVVN